MFDWVFFLQRIFFLNSSFCKSEMSFPTTCSHKAVDICEDLWGHSELWVQVQQRCLSYFDSVKLHNVVKVKRRRRSSGMWWGGGGGVQQQCEWQSRKTDYRDNSCFLHPTPLLSSLNRIIILSFTLICIYELLNIYCRHSWARHTLTFLCCWDRHNEKSWNMKPHKWEIFYLGAATQADDDAQENTESVKPDTGAESLCRIKTVLAAV